MTDTLRKEFQEMYGVSSEEFEKVLILAVQLKDLGIPSIDEALNVIKQATPTATLQEDLYISNKEVEQLHISRQLLHYWVKQNYVRTKAIGKQHLYNYQDLVLLKEKK